MKHAIGAVLATLLCGTAAGQSASLMDLTIENRTGHDDAHVFLMAISGNGTGYFSFPAKTWMPLTSWQFDAALMTASLAQVRGWNADATATLHMPEIASARLYFAVGRNFDRMGTITGSGPESNASNTVPWDKVEFALPSAALRNINTTSVDGFGIACKVTAKTASGTQSVGTELSSEEIFDAFLKIPLSPSGQHAGNTQVFRGLLVRDVNGRVVRVMAPKTPGYADVASPASLPRELTHYFDDYVNQLCWKPNRLFRFHDKNATSSSAPWYYGRVSADGLTLHLYTDAARTQPYAPVPSIPRPSNAWEKPTLPEHWHYDGTLIQSVDEVDWGFVIAGQAGPGTNPPFVTWDLINDPVAMAIPISIARGVMHLDDGDLWMDPAQHYAHGDGTSSMPTYHYAKILRDTAIGSLTYAFSFNDIYGVNPSIYFSDPAVTLRLNPVLAPRRFSTVAPCRLLDTREAGGAIAGAASRALAAAPHTRCGIPAAARALALNVTAVAYSAGGFLTLYRGDGPVPGTSSVNFRAWQTRANNAVVTLAADGTLSLLNGAGDAVHAIVDVAGYFE